MSMDSPIAVAAALEEIITALNEGRVTSLSLSWGRYKLFEWGTSIISAVVKPSDASVEAAERLAVAQAGIRDGSVTWLVVKGLAANEYWHVDFGSETE